ncbi:two-partner secretion domain-containing protein [Kamptonema formosum]|uniref:two-partner secretion domain-containing protein n=1 Tax=Kamptonema formosum TaxID=331992 RepID=UPI0003801F27|nr:filamentous hemagglutinin N-terminal domain-containing protein [Oscillatoria sp. PCC 10802]
MNPTRHLCFLGTISALLLTVSSPARSQIIPDATLPNNSAVTQQGTAVRIEGGTRAGGNLFHSFQEFSLPTGSEAFFNSAPDISNILTRVTGGKISNIDGSVRANGTANLFFINPAGIIFGPNAQLNIGGSFIGSTANSIKFVDGSLFSATHPQTPPLLAVNVPVGLQLGPNPGGIVVRGPRHNIEIDPNNFFQEVTDLYLLNNRPVGLQVSPGKTLALVGGNILLDGGNLTAPAGRIILSGGAGGEVTLAPAPSGWALQYGGVQNFANFANIRFANASSAITAGESGGSIQIQGQQLSLENGSAILSATLGSQPGGNIDIRTADSVELSGASPQGLYSLIVTEAYPGATGKAGNINIETSRLRLLEGGLIFSSSFGTENAGSVTVRASEQVEISGTDSSGFGSYLGTATPPVTAANAGNLTVETKRMILSDGALVTASTSGVGKGGALTVRATESVDMTGADKRNSPTAVQTEAFAGSTGPAGNLTVETGRLSVSNGALISAGTAGAGAAGTLTVRATDLVEVSGTSADGKTPSTITTSVAPGGSGAGGNLTIDTGRLIVRNGGLISSTTASAAPAGNLRINAADSVELTGTVRVADILQGLSSFQLNPSDLRSGLLALSFGGGNAGNIEVNAGKFTASNGAVALASNLGGGQGGSITVSAKDSAEVSGALLTNGNIPGSWGNTGDITINTRNFTVRNGGVISTGTAGFGRGGNLTVNATESVELIGSQPYYILGQITNSNFSAVTLGPAPAGNLTISTRRLTVRDGAILSTITYGPGQGGDLTLKAADSLIVDGGVRGFPTYLATSSAQSGDAGDLKIETGRLTVRNGAFIAADSSATGSAGNLQIIAGSLRMENRGTLSAQTAAGSRGNISVRAGDMQLRTGSNITTNATGTATGGNITISADTLAALENSDISANAAQSQGGRVSVSAVGVFGTQFRSGQTAQSDITATGGRPELSGTVEIKTPDVNPAAGLLQVSASFSDISNQIVSGCAADKGNRFVVTGRGGIPEDPSQPLNGTAIWRDVRLVGTAGTQPQARKTAESPIPPAPPLVEATGWVMGAAGQVQLVANAPTPHSPWYRQTKCGN